MSGEQPVLDLLGRHAPNGLVAFGGSHSIAMGPTGDGISHTGDRTAAQLLADAGRVAEALPEPGGNSHVLLSLDRDRYAMAAALLGTLRRGHAVALAPNSRSDSILAVRDRPEVVALIHDTESGAPFQIEDLLRREAPARPFKAPIAPDQDVIATVFTSGTTGPMKPLRKGRRELFGEAHRLGEIFGVGTGDRIVGTIVPGHIYGLLFTILLPLARGAAFSRETPHHAESVAGCIARHSANVLVTVPVGLRAFDALTPKSFPTLERVFSSTGPLPESVALAFLDRHDLAVTEILGSSETGGIASRERRKSTTGEDSLWKPLEGVQVSQGVDQRLIVDSPFIYSDFPVPFETEDLVSLNEDGTFLHHGRADGIVKIAGQRVSIREMEEAIAQHPCVDEAVVAAIPADGGRGHQLIAAVTPTTAPVPEIKAALRKRFEPSCLPRRILPVDDLPREENGKVPRERLLRLFGLRSDGQPANWTLGWGEIVATTPITPTTQEGAHAKVSLPADYAWFEGHFDGYPVLAGAVQMKELVLPMVTKAFPELGPLKTMNRVKFLERIVPGDHLVVRVERAIGSSRVRFEISKRGAELCSVGHLVLGPATGTRSEAAPE